LTRKCRDGDGIARPSRFITHHVHAQQITRRYSHIPTVWLLYFKKGGLNQGLALAASAPRSKAIKQQAKWGWLYSVALDYRLSGFTLLPMLASLIFHLHRL
jgi:hypothetical protein